MESNVRPYTDNELLSIVRTINGFKGFPKNDFLIFIRSNEDAFDTYDDKVYLMSHAKDGSIYCKTVAPCTTNSGKKGLLTPSRPEGTAVIKFNEWYYDTYQKSDGKVVKHHNGKMQCLRQVRNLKYYRDNNKDKRVDTKGHIYEGNYSTNIHANSYNAISGIISWLIGGWSEGCMVINDLTKYYQILKQFSTTEKISVCCINESAG